MHGDYLLRKKAAVTGKRGLLEDLVLNERAQLVLISIIENYIQSSEPIGSRTLSKSIGVTLSPATIRNIMSDLAELGFLIQTHTSAGRVPTDKAYRFYVNSLSTPSSVPEQIKQKITLVSTEQGMQVEGILAEAVHLLADLTKFACVVSTPKASVSRLQRIELIKISEDRILVILVTKAGVVRDKIIFVKDSHSQDFLNSVASFLNEKFKNHSMQEIREKKKIKPLLFNTEGDDFIPDLVPVKLFEKPRSQEPTGLFTIFAPMHSIIYEFVKLQKQRLWKADEYPIDRTKEQFDQLDSTDRKIFEYTLSFLAFLDSVQVSNITDMEVIYNMPEYKIWGLPINTLR